MLTSTTTIQRSPEGDHGHGTVTNEWGVTCDRNLFHWISQKKTVENTDSRRKSYLFPQVFVTNLPFDQVRFFSVTDVSIFSVQ